MTLSKNCRLKGSSLTESIVAMVIIAVCLSIGIMIYVNVLGTDRNLASIVAEQKVKELLLKTQLEKTFVNEDYTFSGFSISKKTEKLTQKTYKINFEVKTSTKNNTYIYIIVD